MLSKSFWRTNFMIYSDAKQCAMLPVTWQRCVLLAACVHCKSQRRLRRKGQQREREKLKLLDASRHKSVTSNQQRLLISANGLKLKMEHCFSSQKQPPVASSQTSRVSPPALLYLKAPGRTTTITGCNPLTHYEFWNRQGATLANNKKVIMHETVLVSHAGYIWIVGDYYYYYFSVVWQIKVATVATTQRSVCTRK